MVYDDESKNIVFEYLYKELTIREQNKSFEEHIVIFFFDEYGFKSHPISKFISKAKELGVTFVFFGDTKNVPYGTKTPQEIFNFTKKKRTKTTESYFRTFRASPKSLHTITERLYHARCDLSRVFGKFILFVRLYKIIF